MLMQIIRLKFLRALSYQHHRVLKFSTMQKLQSFQSFSWCKPDWSLPRTSKEIDELLEQCANLPSVESSDDINELIKRSKAFPVPFPIETVRLESLKERKPKVQLQKNIVTTYPIVHERVLLLMTNFLVYKRKFGSSIEKAFYKNMTVAEFIDRLLTKRAVYFLGPSDMYLLFSGETGENEQWESVGTMEQRDPLVLEKCLSYDEMKISAMLYVSSHTVCINNGERSNLGQVCEEDIEEDAIIIGVIGPRFERPERMEYEDILVTEHQNSPKNGYGIEVASDLNLINNQSSKHEWRQMWADFYQVPSYTYSELTSLLKSDKQSEEQKYMERFVAVFSKAIFDNEAYYKRLCIIAETALLEAQSRAVEAGRDAFLNVIGAGLGVWKISGHQNDVYILTFVERIHALLHRDALSHVTDVNFAYIRTSESVKDLFTYSSEGNSEKAEMRMFLESKTHPKGGINVQFKNREPSSKLKGEHAGKLLVMTYPWDGNAHPGNEFWLGSLDGSGDPATACSTQVSELHNAHINSAVSAKNARVVSATARCTLQRIQDYCRTGNTSS